MMSGGFITGEIAMPDSGGERYTEGDTSAFEAAAGLAQAFRRVAGSLELRTTIYETYDRGRESLSEEIGRCLVSMGEGVHPQAFLDALTSKLGQSVPAGEAIHLGCLLDPLVQEFYVRGWNELTLDLSCLPVERVSPFALGGDAPWFIGKGLTGTIEKPLVLTYKGDVHNFGEEASYCRLTLEGKCGYAGGKASESFFFLCDTHEAGGRARACSFELGRADSIAYMAENCSFSVRDLSGKDIDEFWRWWIPAHGCTLRTLDEHGRWMVVKG